MQDRSSQSSFFGLRPVIVGGVLALSYCAASAFGVFATAKDSPSTRNGSVVQDEKNGAAEEKGTTTTAIVSNEEDKQKNKKSALERRREELMKGRIDENEKRPEKPTFANRPKSNSGSSDITFDDIKFEMEKTEPFDRKMLTEDITALDGRRVSIRGYIKPSTRQRNLKKFVFVRDNKECCFGPGAALYDCVLVKLAKNVKSDYTVRPVTIEGDFYIKEYTGPDGKIWAIYRMKNGIVK